MKLAPTSSGVLLPKMATSGQLRAAFSLSEPELGSDVQAIKTRPRSSMTATT